MGLFDKLKSKAKETVKDAVNDKLGGTTEEPEDKNDNWKFRVSTDEKEEEVLATKDRDKIMQFYWDRDLNKMKQSGYTEYEILGAGSSKKPACDKCKEMDGKVFKVKDAQPGVNYPPFCDHCRCTTIPVLDPIE